MPVDNRCIGVFDSGIGGLTVVRELQRRLPSESIVYFGDTARVPYGIKSNQTVTRFSREICDFLLRFDPKLIVVACNTASAVALAELETLLPVPIVGVVDPGAKEAVLLSQGHTIAVIATEATILSDAYRRAIERYQPAARVLQKPCPLFVPLVEEGRSSLDPITQSVVRDYLQPILALDPKVLVLGCTHYPMLKKAIAEVAGPGVSLVDSGEQTARAVAERLSSRGGLADSSRPGKLSCYVSDNPQRFKELGQRFLEHTIVDVTWVSQDQLAPHEATPTSMSS
jgi:glutamate racemase